MSETRDDFENRLENLNPKERAITLHMTLRNIPRKFIEEYLEYSEETLDKWINEDV